MKQEKLSQTIMQDLRYYKNKMKKENEFLKPKEGNSI